MCLGFGKFPQRLPQRSGGGREGLIVLQETFR
jgi:hypothetical protein